jgi:flagellar hook assembly protein FlgD
VPEREQSRRITASRLAAPLIFALLVAATVAAFAYAQRLKREPLILDKLTLSPLVAGETVISPNGDGYHDLARVRFRLTRSDRGIVQLINRDDRAVKTFTVKILSEKGRVTARLRPGAELPAFKTFGFQWNGRRSDGKLAPTGPYRLRVRLLGEDRTLVPGGRIKLHTLRRVSNRESGG